MSCRIRKLLADDYDVALAPSGTAAIRCVILDRPEIGGIFTIAFEKGGGVVIETDFAEDDYLYDEIGSGLMVREVRRNRQELFEALGLYYRVFVLHEEIGLDERE